MVNFLWWPGICSNGALEAGKAALLKIGKRVWREVLGAVMEEGEEGAFESIHSSHFSVEETEVQSGKVKCLKSHSTWGLELSVGIYTSQHA